MTDATHNPDGAPAALPPPAVPAPLARGGRALAAAGAVLCAAALATAAGRERLAAGWLWGFAFAWSVTLGGLFLVALHHVTHAVWSVSTRRLAEGLASAMPLVALAFLPLLAFAAWPRAFPLYEWADGLGGAHGHPPAEPHGAADKGGYLTVAFFAARGLACFAVWIAFARFFTGRSLRQDRGEGGVASTGTMRRAAVAFLPLFAGTLTLAGIDWIMSLEPHWFSTIFGVYVFSGVALAGLAAVTLAAVALRRGGRLGDEVRDDHLYSLGALLFAFSCFWAYIAFSQYMLIWYGNIPEEAAYFTRRLEGRWLAASLLLWAVRFAVPFIVLLPRRAKTSARVLAPVAVLVLAGQALDLYWMILPARPAVGLAARWAEAGPILLLAGVLALAFARFLGRHPAVPVGDPLQEACRRFHLPGILALAALAAAAPAARAGVPPTKPAPTSQEAKAGTPVGVEERLGQTLPLAELTFADEDGKPVLLRDLVDRPTVLLLVFFRCAGICTPLMQETARVADLADLKPGEDYRVVTVSFDPSDTPEMARRRKGAILPGMTRRPCPPDAWRFLTGTPEMIARITDAAGFRYRPVDGGQSFNHPAVITFLDRTGQVCRYLYGTQFNPTDFELAVGDASAGHPRSVIQTVRQMCFAYDPDAGYVVRVNRIILVVTLLFAAGFGAFLLRAGRRRKGAAAAVTRPPEGTPT